MATLYWAVYPSEQADATAQQLIDQTVPSGIHSTDVAPTGDTINFTGTLIGGLTAATSYKLSCVWDDAVDTSNVVTTTFVTVSPPPVDVDPAVVSVIITTPDVEVVTTLDTFVDPATVNVEITTPDVQVISGTAYEVEPIPVVVEIVTPTVDVQVLKFVNVDVLTTTVEITTPQVDVEVFKATFVDPITEVVTITAPLVEVVVGIDRDVEPETVTLDIATPAVSITNPVGYLIATEAVPLVYVVSSPGDVRMDIVGIVNAWRNEIGNVNSPFPAVISDHPNNVSVGVGGALILNCTVVGAATYQWYVDDGSGTQPLTGEIGPTLNTTAPATPGVYEYTCMAINAAGIGIRSDPGVVTVS